ncbi:MAG: hypothetical protein CL933_14460 [Deltaproteobacteria bacterium]|nr:hypothetical protein [Deltaproteobacteria bacterium]
MIRVTTLTERPTRQFALAIACVSTFAVAQHVLAIAPDSVGHVGEALIAAEDWESPRFVVSQPHSWSGSPRLEPAAFLSPAWPG